MKTIVAMVVTVLAMDRAAEVGGGSLSPREALVETAAESGRASEEKLAEGVVVNLQ